MAFTANKFISLVIERCARNFSRIRAMLRRVIIGTGFAVVLAGGILVLHDTFDRNRDYRAESLLMLHPFNDALLQSAFERKLKRSCGRISRLEFQVSTRTYTTLKGTTSQTNAVIRLVAAAATREEAEQFANNASEAACVTLRQLYGVTATPLGQAHGVLSSELDEPFRLRFGKATPGPFPTAGPVYFQKPGLSIDPGDGWMRSYGFAGNPSCDPQLFGRKRLNGSFILVSVLNSSYTNLGAAVEAFRPRSDRQKGLVESSYKEEPFATKSGVHGVHSSFVRQYPSPNRVSGGVSLLTQTTHQYLFTNAHSRYVALQNDFVGNQSEQEVQAMIRRTLKVY